MTTILEILKYTLPSIVVFFTAFYIIKRFFDQEFIRKKQNLALKNQEVITPIRLQAYERIVLFLERISPESLVMRVNDNKINCQQMHNELLNQIRSEYEHNLSQQVYVSSQAWELVKNAKSSMTQTINTVADGVDNKEPAIKLSQAILEKVIDMKKSPTFDAIEFLKAEVREYFG